MLTNKTPKTAALLIPTPAVDRPYETEKVKKRSSIENSSQRSYSRNSSQKNTKKRQKIAEADSIVKLNCVAKDSIIRKDGHTTDNVKLVKSSTESKQIRRKNESVKNLAVGTGSDT